MASDGNTAAGAAVNGAVFPEDDMSDSTVTPSGGQAASTSSGETARPTATGEPSSNQTGAGTSTGGTASGGLIPAAGAPGVTDTEIIIGVEALSDPSAAMESVGYNGEGASNAETRRVVDAVFDAINRRGGIAGRTAVPLLHYTDVTVGTHASRGQQACSFFTEDNQVWAVVAQGNHSDPFPVCLAEKGVPLIDDANSLPMDDAQANALSPFIYWPMKLSLSRFDAYIDGLAEAGFFDDGTIGLLRYDRPSHERAMNDVIVPALERHGFTLEIDFAFSEVQSIGDLSGTSAEASNAVLQFRQAGVDRVLFLPTALVLQTLFPPAASSQQYYPRYGINSAEGPKGWTANASPSQLEGAMAVGWNGMSDRGSASENFDNALWVYCRDIMTEHGALEAGAWGCGPYFFLQEAASRAPDLSPQGLRAGADQIGTAAYSTKNYGTDSRPGRWDAVAARITMAYAAACNCFEPITSVTLIP